MPCTPLGTTTTFYGLCRPAAGETGWASAINGNWDTIDTQLNALVTSATRSYLAGLSLINNGRTSIDVQVGYCIATDQSTTMTRTAVLTKDLASAWAVGTGNGGLFTGSATANTWYHVFLIKRTDTNVVDAGFDTSYTAANIPANYTAYRRLGSIRTASASSDIFKFIQRGDEFWWQLATLDSSVTNPGTGRNSRTLTVPTGLKVQAIVNLVGISSATNALLNITNNDTTDQPTSSTVGPLGNMFAINAGAGIWAAMFWMRTNTSGQIATRWNASGADNIENITTLGYVDRRGRDD